MRSLALAVIALCALAPPAAAGDDPPALQRWHLQPDGRGKVEVRLKLPPDQATEMLQETPDPKNAVAAELMRWEGIVAWTGVEADLAAGKTSSLSAVGWFPDLEKVVPARGHGWSITKTDAGLRIEHDPRGQDASRLLDAFLFSVKDSTFALIRQGLPTILRRRAPATSVVQVVIPPGPPRAPSKLTLADGRARVVIDLKRQLTEARVLMAAITALRAELAAKKRTRAEAVAEAFGRLKKSLARFDCASAAPSAAFAQALQEAQRDWSTSPWRNRIAALRAIGPKLAPPADAPVPERKPLAFEPNDTRAQAKRVLPGTYGGLLLKGEDWYRVDTPKGHSAAISVRFFPAFGDIDLEVFGASGPPIRRAVGRGRAEHVSIDPRGEALWVRVWNPDRRWKPIQTDATYTLSVAHVPYTERDALEPNDPPHPPRRIGIGGHKNLIGDGLDVYRVKPPPAGASKLRRLKVVLRFEKSDDLDLELRDARGALLAASRGTGDTEQAATLEPPGGLTIRVLGLGKYTLEVTAVAGPDLDPFEPNDSRAAAKPLTAGRHPALLLNTEDWYRITLAPGRALSVTAAAAKNQPDLDLELYDARGNLLKRSASIGRPESVALAGHPPGVVFVRVHAAGFASYDLQVDDTAFRPADRFEPNESRSAAKPIPLGAHARLRCTGEDWYRIPTPPAGKRLRVEITFDLAREGDLDLELYAGSRRVAAARELTARERLEWEGVGELTLRVFPGTARYRLTIEHR